MKWQPEPSTQEVLAGLVERVTYHNEEKITVTSSRWPRAFDPQNAERHRVS